MLNDDVLDDLDGHVTDPSILELDKDTRVIVKVVNNLPGKLQEVGTQAVKAISQAQTSFELIDKHNSKIIDMTAVHDEISTEGIICKADVAYALEQFPIILNDKLKLEHFSLSRTKVNHSKVVSGMKLSIEAEQSLLFESAKAFFKQPLEDALSAIKGLETHYLPALTNTSNDLQIDARNISGRLEGSKNTLVRYKDDYKTFLDIPVKELLPEMFLGGTMDADVFVKAISNIDNLFGSRVLRVVISSIVYGKDVEQLFSDESMRSETIHDLTFKDLLTFYCSDKLTSLLSIIPQMLTDAVSEIEYIKNSSKIDSATPAELHTYLLDNNVVINKKIKAIGNLANGIISLLQLNFNTQVLFEQLKRA